jgi:hypothetical protein
MLEVGVDVDVDEAGVVETAVVDDGVADGDVDAAGSEDIMIRSYEIVGPELLWLQLDEPL